MSNDDERRAPEVSGSGNGTAVRLDAGVEEMYRMARRSAQQSAGVAAGEKEVEPLPAVAAVMWRRGRSGRLEVLMGQRAQTMLLAPGMWTFPGGGVTPADRPVAAESSLERALIREVAEETGLKIADLPRLEAGRYRMPALGSHLSETHFFLVEVVADEVEISAGNGELIGTAWISPSAALGRWRRCEWVMPPITRGILQALEPAENGHGDMAAAAQRCKRAASLESDALRLYELVPGIFKSPLRTPEHSRQLPTPAAISSALAT